MKRERGREGELLVPHSEKRRYIFSFPRAVVTFKVVIVLVSIQRSRFSSSHSRGCTSIP